MHSYASIYKAICDGLVSKPSMLKVQESRPVESPRRVYINIYCAVGDQGQLNGKRAVRIQAFKFLFTFIAMRRDETIQIIVHESHGRPQPMPLLDYDKKWDRDDEVLALIQMLLESMYEVAPKVSAWPGGNKTTFLVEKRQDVPEEVINAIHNIFHAWGNVNRRSIWVEYA